MSHNIGKLSKTVSSVAPCGNPKRYDSRDVVRMEHGVKRGHEQSSEEGEGTEGEKHLKNLVKQQTKKDMTVAEHISQHREFTPATSHAPEVEKLVGVHDFSQYRQVEALDSQIEELRHCGLSDEEIAVKLADDMKLDTSSSGYGTNPAIRLARLEEIRQKIQAKHRQLSQPDTFKGALVLSRREREIDDADRERHGTDGRGQGPPAVITTQKTFAENHPDDPVNHIGEMMTELEGKAERDSRIERRKRRKMERKKQYYDQFVETFPGCEDRPNKGSSDDEADDNRDAGPEVSVYGSWTAVDSGQSNDNYEKSFSTDKSCVLSNSEGATEACKSTDCKTLREIPVDVPILTESEVLDNRLSIEEIKSIEKFKNYDPGTPNKVVYVKNLPSNTTEQDLLSMFGMFQAVHLPKIIFRLLTGRMKGQAFVTFPDEESAKKAVQIINGYKMKDKPVILCFGKKQS